MTALNASGRMYCPLCLQAKREFLCGGGVRRNNNECLRRKRKAGSPVGYGEKTGTSLVLMRSSLIWHTALVLLLFLKNTETSVWMVPYRITQKPQFVSYCAADDRLKHQKCLHQTVSRVWVLPSVHHLRLLLWCISRLCCLRQHQKENHGTPLVHW